MTFMVIDLTDERTCDPRPFGKFGPFDTKDEAEAFIQRRLHPDNFMVMSSVLCR